MTHPALRIDEVVHQRTRLAILVVVNEASQVDFTYLRDTLDLTAGNLSRHLSVLTDAGLVTLHKTRGARETTRVRITTEGRSALAREMELLEQLVDQVMAKPARRAHPAPLLGT